MIEHAKLRFQIIGKLLEMGFKKNGLILVFFILSICISYGYSEKFTNEQMEYFQRIALIEEILNETMWNSGKETTKEFKIYASNTKERDHIASILLLLPSDLEGKQIETPEGLVCMFVLSPVDHLYLSLYKIDSFDIEAFNVKVASRNLKTEYQKYNNENNEYRPHFYVNGQLFKYVPSLSLQGGEEERKSIRLEKNSEEMHYETAPNFTWYFNEPIYIIFDALDLRTFGINFNMKINNLTFENEVAFLENHRSGESEFYKKTETGEFLNLSKEEVYDHVLSGELEYIFFHSSFEDQFYRWIDYLQNRGEALDYLMNN